MCHFTVIPWPCITHRYWNDWFQAPPTVYDRCVYCHWSMGSLSYYTQRSDYYITRHLDMRNTKPAASLPLCAIYCYQLSAIMGRGWLQDWLVLSIALSNRCFILRWVVWSGILNWCCNPPVRRHPVKCNETLIIQTQEWCSAGAFSGEDPPSL